MAKPAPAPPFRPSWPAACASLVAFLALTLTGCHASVTGLAALLLLGTYVAPWRFPEGSWAHWMVRVMVFGTLIAINVQDPSRLPRAGVYHAGIVSAVGELLIAELVLQCWRAWPSGGPRGAVLILLSGAILLTACNSFDHRTHRHMRLLGPAFACFSVLALRGIRARGPAAGAGRRLYAWAARGVALSLALGFGGASVWGLHTYRGEIANAFRDFATSFRARARVGFDGNPRLESGMSLKRSMERVLRLHGQPAEPHLRGLAFDTYALGRWLPALTQQELDPVPIEELTDPRAAAGTVTATRLSDDLDLLFAPLHSAEVRPTRTRQVQRGRRDPGLLRFVAPAPYEYAFSAAREARHQGPLSPPLGPEALLRCLDVPLNVDPKVRELAERITAGLPDAQAKIDAVVAYLAAHHEYSLELPAMHGDPVSDFLLHERPGHCEFFASAATILLRYAGVPTRFAVGYYAHEGLGNGEVLVRQQDAHAWAESWIEGAGWVTVEATPPGGLPAASAEQPAFYRRAAEWLYDAALAIGDWWLNLSWTEIGLIAGASAAGLIAFLWLREVLARRRLARPAEGYAGPRELTPLAARFEALLKRAGLPCPAHLEWSEHLAAPPAGSGRGLDLDAARAFANEYLRLRFGPDCPAEELERLRERLRRLKG
ncbi:MAG: transglutaminase-like domain-containing protein [Planctomycetota bacterium]|nr:transglutaminase-like domain-containing protein [Planctomycetota bacterium]